MSKPFHFKQFSIEQDRCAMKVGMDGVLLGAWVRVNNAKSFLDVGTGTGLISLQIAQRFNNVEKIQAIDVDEDAVCQANQNFNNSQWSNRLSVDVSSLQEFNSDLKFDHIISNPPFFKEGTLITDKSRSLARYSTSLPLDELVEHAIRLSGDKVCISLILPFQLLSEIEAVALNFGLCIARLTCVKTRMNKAVERILVELSSVQVEKIRDELVVLEGKGRHDYTREYVMLVKEFYTIL